MYKPMEKRILQVLNNVSSNQNQDQPPTQSKPQGVDNGHL